MIDKKAYEGAVFRLWEYLVRNYSNEGLLVGPDPVGRINGAAVRFGSFNGDHTPEAKIRVEGAGDRSDGSRGGCRTCGGRC